jgi:hypothetical protein
MGQVFIKRQRRRRRKRTTTTLLNHDTGWVIGRVLLPGGAGAAIRKEAKLRQRDGKAAEPDCKEGRRSVWRPILHGWHRPT